MKLTAFQSDKGDCLLVTSSDGRHLLVDGGMRTSYSKHVAPALGKLRKKGDKLDLVYVSHIDQDHISGVLQMLDDLVAWRVFDFHSTAPAGNRRMKKPKVERPPEIDGIWHNAFHEQLQANAGPITDMLAAMASLAGGVGTIEAEDIAEYQSSLVSSEREAVRLSRRVGARQLNIPLNQEFGGQLIMVRDNQPAVQVGSMSLSVIGPFPVDLENLRERWNTWLAHNQNWLRRQRQKAKDDEEELGSSEVERLINPMLALAQELGRRSRVTEPNLASLMLLLEDSGNSVLLTGDGHATDILKGLRHLGRIDGGAGIHVDVLKVQHHGSEHNADLDFCRAVTADHYLFCGNGAHHNPDLQIVKTFARSRIGEAAERSPNTQVDRPFKFWFTSSSTDPDSGAENAAHMGKVETLVRQLSQESGQRMTSSFLKKASFEIAL